MNKRCGVWGGVALLVVAGLVTVWQGGPASPGSYIDATRELADQGDVQAQTQLGSMYAEGKGVAQDDTLAVTWSKKAAVQGSPRAQVLLGFMLAQGKGGAKDIMQSVSWYRKAAEQGVAEAQYQLGSNYAKGEGVPQNYSFAYAWFSLAADQGHADSLKFKELVATRFTQGQRRDAQALADGFKDKIGAGNSRL